MSFNNGVGLGISPQLCGTYIDINHTFNRLYGIDEPCQVLKHLTSEGNVKVMSQGQSAIDSPN